MFEVNEIVYNSFMYKDGDVLGCNEESVVYRAKHISGTLKELTNKLEGI